MRFSLLAVAGVLGLASATVPSDLSGGFDQKLKLRVSFTQDLSRSNDDGQSYSQYQMMYQPNFAYDGSQEFNVEQKFVVVAVDTSSSDRYLHYVHHDFQAIRIKEQIQTQIIASQSAPYMGWWAPGYLGESGQGRSYSFLMYKQPDNFRFRNLPQLSEKIKIEDFENACGLQRAVTGIDVKVDIKITDRNYNKYNNMHNQHGGYGSYWNYMPQYNPYNMGYNQQGNYGNQYQQGWNQNNYMGYNQGKWDQGSYNQKTTYSQYMTSSQQVQSYQTMQPSSYQPPPQTYSQQQQTYSQQQTYQQNTYQQNTYQQNTYQQNTYQQNTYQQNTYQQQTYQQSPPPQTWVTYAQPSNAQYAAPPAAATSQAGQPVQPGTAPAAATSSPPFPTGASGAAPSFTLQPSGPGVSFGSVPAAAQTSPISSVLRGAGVPAHNGAWGAGLAGALAGFAAFMV